MHLNRFVAICCALLAVGLFARAADAAEACAVLSRQIAPYEDALKGVREGFPGKVVPFTLENSAPASAETMRAVQEHACPVVVAIGSSALKLLKLRVQKPIVYALVFNPFSTVGSDPNITGVRLAVAPGVLFEAITKVLPRATRIGYLYAPSQHVEQPAEIARLGKALGLDLIEVTATSIGEAIRAVPALARRVDALMMIPDAITSSDKVFETMLATSYRDGIPLIALSSKHVQQGGLMAVVTDYLASGRQAGKMAARIAGGSLPSAVKTEYAPAKGVALNLKSAGKLGLTIPAEVVSQATEVHR